MAIVPSQKTLSFFGLDSTFNTATYTGEEVVGISTYYLNKYITTRDDEAFQRLHEALQRLWSPGFLGPSLVLSEDTHRFILNECLRANKTALLDLILVKNKQPLPVTFLSWLKLNEPSISYESLQKA